MGEQYEDLQVPRWQRECGMCLFLGGYVDCHGERYDLWYCPQGKVPTLLARWASDGPAYVSGMDYGKQMQRAWGSPIGEAYRRARAAGLIPDHDAYHRLMRAAECPAWH